MRIGIDIRAIGNQRTGDETYTLQLVKSLMKFDTENQYFLYTDAMRTSKLKKINELLAIKNGNFKIVSVGPSSKILWTMYSLQKQAKKDKLDILHVQYITPLFLTKKASIKIVTTVHDISFARYPEHISKKDIFILKLLIRVSLRKADKIVAVSQFTKDEIIDVYGVPADKIKLIYNGGVAQDFKEEISENNLLEFRKKYDIIKPYLLFLGTLQPRKNIPFLIQSFVKLKVTHNGIDKIKELTLVIRGKRDGHNYDSKIDVVLKSVKSNYPDIYRQIKFIGYISNEEIPMIFKAAAAFCFTSVYEGFGLPLLESMTVETPVVVSRTSCFPEIVEDAGVIYRIDDRNDWVEKVKNLISNSNLQSELISAGIERARFFSWDKNAKQTVSLYKELKIKAVVQE